MEKKLEKISKDQLDRNKKLGLLRSVDWKKSKSNRYCEVYISDDKHFTVESYTAGFQNSRVNGINKTLNLKF